jgi:predicted Rossmann fold flavoprotein
LRRRGTRVEFPELSCLALCHLDRRISIPSEENPALPLDEQSLDALLSDLAKFARLLASNLQALSFSALPPSCDVAIVGAGAAGLATSIFTRRFNDSRSVVLLEGARKPGAKILVSGGARCNVTNTIVSERDFWGGRPAAIRRVLRGFPVPDTIAFFRDIGVTLHEEAGGKLFPDSNRARDVLDALLNECERTGVLLKPGVRVVSVERSNGAFRVVTSGGDLHAAAVVLATGGQSLPRSGSDGAGYEMARRLGHTIVERSPALAPLVLSEPSIHRRLSGVSQDVELAMWADGAIVLRLTGALLWTHFGVSGPVAMNASRHWLQATLAGRQAAVTVNFRPGRQFDQIDAELQQTAATNPKIMVRTVLASMVPASVADAMLGHLAIDGELALAHLSRDHRRRLAHALVEWVLPVVDSRGYNFAEATAGGVALDELDAATMQSRVCPGLYCVGEILDVDGRIGGFNFQWAWSSAFVAARALAGGVEPGSRPAAAQPDAV